MTMRPHLLLLAGLALLAMTACRRQKELTRTTEQRDSVVVRYVPRDTVIWIVRDSVSVRAELPLPGRDLPPVSRTRNGATATLSVSNGVAQASCEFDSTAYKLRLWDKWTRETSSLKDTSKEVITVTEVPSWCWWLLAAAGLYVLWRLRKVALLIIKACPL